MKYELRSYEIFSFGKCEGRASPLNYIERSGKAVRLPKHLRSKYFTYAKHIFHIHRKVNISYAAGVFHYHNLTATPLNYDLCYGKHEVDYIVGGCACEGY